MDGSSNGLVLGDLKEDTHKKVFFSIRTTKGTPLPRDKWIKTLFYNFLSIVNGLKWIENAEYFFGQIY